MKRSSKERIARDERDSYRRSEMEFGVAADAYRSDPSRKATRNGAVMVTVVLALAAFLAVLAFGSLFGAFGAFLALPVTASLQAIFRAYTKRYELIDSPLMNDPTPEKKSKIVEASEAFGEHVLQPIGEHMPRAAKGSTSRVPMNEELRLLQEQIYAIPPHETKESDLDDSATVAIPQRGAADTQQSEQPKQRKQTKQSDQSASSNPRAGWR